MRHSHAVMASTWSTTWFSTYWQQRIAAAVTATNAVFIGRILNADAAAACGGFKANKPPRFPRYCFFDPRRARGSMVPSSAAGCSHLKSNEHQKADLLLLLLLLLSCL